MLEVSVPALPESVADATLVAWHKKPGDRVSRDENLADLETDKVVLEVPAPAAGILVRQAVDVGAIVKSGALLAVLEIEAGGAKRDPTNPPESTAVSELTIEVKSAKPPPAALGVTTEHQRAPAPIPGFEQEGRITRQETPRAMRQSPPSPPQQNSGDRAERRVPMTRLRARIAERLIEAQSTQALLTTFNEVDMSALYAARARHKEQFQKAHGARLGIMSFFVKAAVYALQQYPVINTYVDGADIIYHGYCDIGVAVSTERGLVVPVLRSADRMSIAEIERAIATYATKAREGSITLEELSGGTFSITNGGVFGSLLSTPIVNTPQSAILGMHRVQDRSVVLDGAVVVRPMMYLALSYDHRIIDGREAVHFLVAIKEKLEDPVRLLLQI